MPQLDHVSYFSQFFWVSLLFLTFYVIVVSYILPRIAIILKVRKKLNTVDATEKDNRSTQLNSYDIVLTEGVQKTRDLLVKAHAKSTSWSTSTSDKILFNTLDEVQNKYLESIGYILSRKYVLRSLLNKQNNG